MREQCEAVGLENSCRFFSADLSVPLFPFVRFILMGKRWRADQSTHGFGLPLPHGWANPSAPCLFAVREAKPLVHRSSRVTLHASLRRENPRFGDFGSRDTRSARR